MYQEYIEMIWFFTGVFAYRALTTLLTYGHMVNLVKSTNKQVLKMLAAIAEDIGFIRGMKYKTMLDADIPDDQIAKIEAVDERTFEIWKGTCVAHMLVCCPKIYRHTIPYSDWESAMVELDRHYKAEYKKYERKIKEAKREKKQKEKT